MKELLLSDGIAIETKVLKRPLSRGLGLLNNVQR